VVRYADLRPCTTAFIDARSPGSDRKENFTIIGPGVAENPDQHVHISLAHGFNIGGARQPPGCTNSQHSHETAEVFVVHSGRWAFRTGERADDGEIVLGQGDVISIPTQVFRGFENVGEDTGFLFAVLGGDDPGKVTWAPGVLEKAAGYGLILLESGRLIDTVKGETMPSGQRAVTPVSAAELSAIRRFQDDDLRSIVLRSDEVVASPDGPLAAQGVTECPLIGMGAPAEPMAAGPLNWPHGFNLRRMDLAPGAATANHSRCEAEVIFVHGGRLIVSWEDHSTTEVGPGDTITIPVGQRRRFIAGPDGATAFIVRGDDQPQAPEVFA
jgi:quercetin dioxygenase-like cupin family protein